MVWQDVFFVHVFGRNLHFGQNKNVFWVGEVLILAGSRFWQLQCSWTTTLFGLVFFLFFLTFFMPCYVCFDMTFTFMLRRLCSRRLRDATRLKRSRNFRYARDATLPTGSWAFRHARDVKLLGTVSAKCLPCKVLQSRQISQLRPWKKKKQCRADDVQKKVFCEIPKPWFSHNDIKVDTAPQRQTLFWDVRMQIVPRSIKGRAPCSSIPFSVAKFMFKGSLNHRLLRTSNLLFVLKFPIYRFNHHLLLLKSIQCGPSQL